MHANEVHTDAQLARRLLAAQFPQWANLPRTPVLSAGTDNALYRLGSDRVVRLPRIDWAVGQAEKERRWLSRHFVTPSPPAHCTSATLAREQMEMDARLGKAETVAQAAAVQ